MDEPDYLVVLDEIYEKDATVGYPDPEPNLDELNPDKRSQRRRKILETLPESRSLLPIPSMSTWEVKAALASLAALGLIEEAGGIPLPGEMDPNPRGWQTTLLRAEYEDDIRYVKLTEMGFDVAHERAVRRRRQEVLESQNATSERIANLTERQSDSSHLLAVVTVLLGATALIQATAAVFSLSWPQNALLGVLYVMLLLLLWFTRDRWYRITDN